MDVKILDVKIIGLAVASAIAGALFMVWVLVQVWVRTDNPAVKAYLHHVLYFLDEQCDNIDTPAKKTQAVMAIQALLGWKRVWIPMVLIGFALDLLVKLIRKTGIPDLHKTDVAPAMAPDPTDKGRCIMKTNIVSHDYAWANELTQRPRTDLIVVHHTASDPSVTVEDIHQMHLNNRWAGIGYHLVIYPDGRRASRPATGDDGSPLPGL